MNSFHKDFLTLSHQTSSSRAASPLLGADGETEALGGATSGGPELSESSCGGGGLVSRAESLGAGLAVTWGFRGGRGSVGVGSGGDVRRACA